MKTVVLSFDDARKDFYTRAFPILNKYGLTATLNVISDFILNPRNYSCFESANNEPIHIEELLLCQNQGIEIACHGHLHLNTKADILENIKTLKELGVKFPHGIGFASPNSELTMSNIYQYGISDLIYDKTLSYVRSGIQIRREGLLYTAISLLSKYTKSHKLWYWLNYKNIIQSKHSSTLLPSITIHSYTTLNQIMYLINNMPDHATVILMFHSICKHNDSGYGKDKWYWDYESFDQLCCWLSHTNNITVCNTLNYIQQ